MYLLPHVLQNVGTTFFSFKQGWPEAITTRGFKSQLSYRRPIVAATFLFPHQYSHKYQNKQALSIILFAFRQRLSLLLCKYLFVLKCWFLIVQELRRNMGLVLLHFASLLTVIMLVSHADALKGIIYPQCKHCGKIFFQIKILRLLSTSQF